MAAATDGPPIQSGLRFRDRPLAFALLLATGILLVAAGVIHFLAAGVHYDHAKGHGVFFLFVGLMQIAAAVLLFLWPQRWTQVLAAVATGGIFLLWVLTLFIATPFGEEEPDIYAYTSKTAELLGFFTLLGFALLARGAEPGASRSTPRSAGGAPAAAAIAGILVAASLVSAAGMWGFGLAVEPLFPEDWVHGHDHHDHGHGHGHGHHHDHDDDHGHDLSVHLMGFPTEGVLPFTVGFTVHASGLHGDHHHDDDHGDHHGGHHDDPHGERRVVTWAFDAGDGTVRNGTADDFEEEFTHTYESAGEFLAVFLLREGDHTAQDSVTIVVELPDSMQASWTFGESLGCQHPTLLCEGHSFSLSDPRYAGLPFAANATGSLAGAVGVDFLDAEGGIIQSADATGTIPEGTVSAFLFSEGPASEYTFTVELPEHIPEA